MHYTSGKMSDVALLYMLYMYWQDHAKKYMREIVAAAKEADQTQQISFIHNLTTIGSYFREEMQEHREYLLSKKTIYLFNSIAVNSNVV